MTQAAALAAQPFLAALQLADSFFPSGMYTQSHGLEAFVAAEKMHDAAAIETLLQSYLREVVGPTEALAARWVARLAADRRLEPLTQLQGGQPGLGAGRSDYDLAAQPSVLDIDRRLEATKLSDEGRSASRRCGGRVLALATTLYEDARLTRYAELARSGTAPGHQAVALALAGSAAGLDEETAVAVEIHGFVVGLLGAATRLGAIDHVQAQVILRRAQPLMAQVAAEGQARDWREIGGFAPQIEIMQFRHANANARLFVS